MIPDKNLTLKIIYMEALAIVVLISIFLFIFERATKCEPLTDEELTQKAVDLALQEKKLKRIYWHIDEIKRISDLKTIAIQAGDMVEFQKLCDEKDYLDRLYKIENPELK